MRPVNLLPERDRVRRPSAEAAGTGSYVVLGVLGALLIAVLGYVVTQNSINQRTSDIARATQEKQEAEQRVARLGAYGEFAAIKQQRVQSVTQLAQQRFDWERLMRELALVLPEGTYLTDVAASATGQTDGSTPPAPAPTATGAPAAVAAPSPAVTLTGCSENQEKVAVLLVRLRKLHRASDVKLTESAEEDRAESEGGFTSEPAAAPGAASNTGCPNYKFDVSVEFAPLSGDEPEAEKRKVPATLGGGA